jgi:probable rRNA maturation factor
VTSFAPFLPMQTEQVDILVECDAWHTLENLEVLTRVALNAVIKSAGLKTSKTDEVCVLFTDDATIRTLNRDWRGIDKPTNVLSFPAAPSPHLEEGTPLGDIALAFETVEREAKAESKSIKNHTLHLIIHGFLHLHGYDHETDEEAVLMENAEIEALKELGVVNPYLEESESTSKT